MRPPREYAVEIDEGKWRQHALCKELPTEVSWKMFFPHPGRYDAVSEKARRDLCDACPVKKECNEYAVVNQMLGYWGGTSAKKRRYMEPNFEEFGERYSRGFVSVFDEHLVKNPPKPEKEKEWYDY
jgi:hypothetical protein